MILPLFRTTLGLLMMLASCAMACNKASSGARRPKKPTPGVVHEPTADVWLGAIEFVDYFCGFPSHLIPPPTPRASAGPPVQPARYVVPGFSDQIAQDMKLPTGVVNPYKFDHSFVYFRGQAFEWGAGIMIDYSDGNIGRDSHQCPAVWSLQTPSNCTLKQAETIAAQFSKTFGSYNLLTNNCHHFSEWFMSKLTSGKCTIPV